MDRYDYMQRAYLMALKAKSENETPVGCVIVKDAEIIAEGYNRTKAENCATKHAELVAIEAASKKLGSDNLSSCELYVTLEPCPMCAGAIMNSKIKKVVFGAFDLNYGACGTALDLFSLKGVHKTECFGGICEEKCSELLKDFFKDLRN